MEKKKILVSQPRPTSEKSPYFDIAKKYDVDIVFRPMIKVEGLSAKEFRQSKININDFTAVIFSARTAVDHFFRLCEESRVKIPDTMKYFCLTESIALYLQKYIVYRKRKIFFGTTGKIDDPQLLSALEKNGKEKFLFPVSSVNKDNMSILEEHGIDFTKAVMYRTVSNDFTPDEPFDYDVLIFFSPAGIDSLKKNFPEFDQERKKVVIGAFGKETADAVVAAGFHVDIAAPNKENPSMTSALESYLRREPDEE
ncbi:MAG: uroporphyrinogen-III synthase [Clostridium sp.]|nr:uroporphyrinogen-III synthase [Prevotella sp.]MCM1429687.1 uroporphyrinogen-III synthase [Clostridium sp.]MCM1476158.1 uroporphyrinogen-III synthase [Muribaculaceae bacterium]